MEKTCINRLNRGEMRRNLAALVLSIPLTLGVTISSEQVSAQESLSERLKLPAEYCGGFLKSLHPAFSRGIVIVGYSNKEDDEYANIYCTYPILGLNKESKSFFLDNPKTISIDLNSDGEYKDNELFLIEGEKDKSQEEKTTIIHEKPKKEIKVNYTINK